MFDLIQGYVRGDFGGGVYDPVLWFMAWIVLATLVSGTVLSLTTKLRERRIRDQLSDDLPDVVQRRLDNATRVLDPPERFSLRHLLAWHPITLVLLSAISAASLWLGWHIVVLPLAAATVVSYLWHFHLRRSGVRWAAVYSLATWILPYIVMVVAIISFHAPIEWDCWGDAGPDVWTFSFHCDGVPVRAFVYSRLSELDPSTLTIVCLWSLGALAASLTLARIRHPLINPMSIAVVAIPAALWFWFVNPWAMPLGAFAMVLLGHAMSRERRLRIRALDLLSRSSGDERVTRWPDLWASTKKFDPIVVMLIVATVTVVVLSYDELVYHWARGLLRDYETRRVWYDILRTASVWVPLLSCGALGIIAMRKVAAPAQVAPYLASALLIAVMSDALFEADWYVREFTWLDFTLTGDFETFREKNIEGSHVFVYTGPRLVWPGIAGVTLALSLVIAVGLLLTIAWQVVRGKLEDYGGLLCGMAWIVIVYWVLELAVLDSERGGHILRFWRYELNDLLLANLTIAAIAMLTLLYWGFGPGSIRTGPRQPRL